MPGWVLVAPSTAFLTASAGFSYRLFNLLFPLFLLVWVLLLSCPACRWEPRYGQVSISELERETLGLLG